MIAEAEAEADAGLLIPSAEVKAWIDSLGTAKPLPMPSPATSWIKPSL
jgi:predicted transcriptional regulator